MKDPRRPPAVVPIPAAVAAAAAVVEFPTRTK
jgi:hypothetical protein